VGGSKLKANSWSGKKVLVIAATLVLVLSAGLAVVHQSQAKPVSAPAASSAASAVTATVTNAVTRSVPTSPHPGTIEAYLNQPAGANTVDPAIAYYTVDYEPIMNVFETLVNYNGSSTSTFIPTAATCVPGTPQCTTDYGSGSIPGFTGIFNASGDVFTGSNGLPTYWTYVVDPAAQFYDPVNHVGWPVYPTDVQFSIARTISAADPFGENSGWIISQALVPFTDQGPLAPALIWDHAHSGFNNTPYWTMSSMLINDTNYCPASVIAGTNGHGCITFVANSGGAPGVDWPEFNDFIADNLGASIVPCGYYQYVGAGLPGFPGTHAANGDGACKLPGGVTSTQAPAYQSWLASVSPMNVADPGNHGIYLWDAQDNRSWHNWPAVWVASQGLLLGSGPYDGSIVLAAGYGLSASPSYAQPSACGGDPAHYAQYTGYCDPAPGGFIGNVQVTFEVGDAQGLTAYQAGTSDWSDILVNHFSAMLQLQSLGKLNILNTPSLSVFQQNYVMNWNSTQRATLGLSGINNIPKDFFAWSAARGLLQSSYPFTTIESNVWTSEGLQSLIPVGGQIPYGMACYYAPTTANGCTNSYTVPWQYEQNGGTVNTNPATVGGAAWWWAQGRNPSSPYYDPELANCTTGSPCQFTIESSTGAPPQDAANSIWISSIEAVTGGALEPNTADIAAGDLLDDCGEASAAVNPCPVFNFGWIPDYPDPSDYEGAYGVINGTYTFPDDAYMLYNPVFNNPTACTHSAGSLADLVYWANQANSTVIANDCQGVAYNVYVWSLNTAGPLAAGPYRILLYDLGQTIMNALNFYTWTGQQNVYFTAAPWIATSTINTNVLIGTGDDQFWFQFKYVTAVHTTNETFKESGLPKGTTWEASIGGQTFATNTSLLVIPLQTGTYPYKLIGTNFYSAASPTGTLTVGATPTTTKVKFLNAGSTVTFKEKGLPKGTPWNVFLLATNYTTTSSKQSLRLGAGDFSYAITQVPAGYKVSYTPSFSTTPPKGVTLKVTFSPYNAYGVTFTPKGLPNEKWSVSIKLTKGTGLLAPKPPKINDASNTSISWTDLANGTYTYKVSAKGYTAPAGSFVINGSSASVMVNFTVKAKPAFAGAEPALMLMPNLVAPTATPSRAHD